MYKQKQTIDVTPIYNLAVRREDVDARKLYNACWEIYTESKIVDLDMVMVVYPRDKKEMEEQKEKDPSKYCKYSDLPEEVKQLTALCVCLIGRWFNDLKGARDTMLARFKLTCKPTDFWHDKGIFKNDDIKCNNMQELIEKIKVK